MVEMDTECYFFFVETQGLAGSRPTRNQVNAHLKPRGGVASGEREFSRYQQEGREGGGLRIAKSILNQSENCLCGATELV